MKNYSEIEVNKNEKLNKSGNYNRKPPTDKKDLEILPVASNFVSR